MDKDKEFLDNEATKLMEEEDKYVDETLAQREDLDSEELKELYSKEIRAKYIANLFNEREEWKNNLMALRDYKVLKYTRVMQTLFYLLSYDRESICEPKSNKFFWKKAKNYLNDEFLSRLVNYQILGPKEDSFTPY